MKFIELFAGIGAFRLGLEQTGHECVFSNEWLEKPASIYERNFGERPDTRDVRTITIDTLPDADLVVGGFPCGTFSIAGKRTGLSLEDARGELFYEMFRLARDKGIPFILFENVEGLLNHDGGRTFGFMLTVLDEMGYDAQWELLDSQYLGVPQHRERVFVVANLRGRPRPQIFPLGQTSGAHGADNEEEQAEGTWVQTQPDRRFAVGTVLHRIYGGDSNNPYIECPLPDLTDDERDIFTTQRRHGFHSERSAALTPDMGLVMMHMRSHTQANMIQKEQLREASWTLDTSPQNKMALDNGYGYRKFTPVECERLQGLPDNWTKWYADGRLVSDAERYERCGRAVTVNVIREIGAKLKTYEQGSAS